MKNKPVKLGLLVHKHGPMGIWTPSCEASALLSVAEINTWDGILGRELDLVIADAGDNDSTAVDATRDLIDLHEVDAIVAMITSSAHQQVLKTLRNRVPLIYTTQFEGGRHGPSDFTIGETTEEMLVPALDWFIQHKNASKFYFVGSNYIWPLRSMELAGQLAKSRGGSVIGRAVTPYGSDMYDEVIDDIARLQPHVVMTWLVGQESVNFHRKFAEHGLQSKTLRFSTAVEETILYALGENCTENFYVASSYFSGIRSRNNDSFLERYHGLFGAVAPPPNGYGESVYEGVHCLRALIEAAGNIQAADLQKKFGRAAQNRTARGDLHQICAGNPRHPIHLAVVDGFDINPLHVG